jgi:hypothetical protein
MNLIKTLVIAAVLIAQAGPGSGGAGVIEGRLLSADGKPADGVSVAAIQGDPAPVSSRPSSEIHGIAVTDASGHYRLEGLDPGRYRVVAGLLNWLTYYPGVKDGGKSTTIEVTDASLKTGVDFTLQSPVGVRVSGLVTRSNPRATLPQFATLNNNPGNGVFEQLQIRVAADGSFEFFKVPPGTYQARIIPEVIGSQPLQITVLDKDVGGIEFLVPSMTTVSGRVIVDDGSPMPRMALSFVGSGGTVNAMVSRDGSFTIQVPEGDKRIVVSGIPSVYSLKSIALGSSDLILEPLKVGESDVHDVVITLNGPPPGMWFKVKGRVVRPASNPGPIPNKVMLSGLSMPDLEAPIAADGSFEFPKVLPGTYRAQALPSNERQNPVSVNVVRDIDGMEIVMPRQFEVSGRTVVDLDGPMVPRFSLQATSLSGNSVNTIAGNGTFRMILPEGTYRFMTSGFPAGYSVRSMKSGSVDLLREPLIAVGTAPIPEVVVTIGVSTPPPWRKVSGRVIASPGSSMPAGIRVALDGEFGSLVANVNPEGSYEFSRILPGAYRFSINPPLEISPTTLTVGDKDVKGFEVRLSVQMELSGRVSIEGGAPLPPLGLIILRANGAVLYSSKKIEIRPPGTFNTMVTEGEYRITIDGLPPGYVLKSITSGSVDLTQSSLKVTASTPSEIVVIISGQSAVR